MRHIIIVLSLLATLLSGGAQAGTVEVKGVKFSDTLEVAQQNLTLNGTGVRVKVIINVYVAALYLPQKATTGEAAVSQAGAKSLQAVMLRDVSAESLVEAMEAGFKANNTTAMTERHAGRLQDLGKLMRAHGTAPRGAALHIDFLPTSGTRIVLNGQRMGSDIPGEEFYQCLMRIWLGNKPVDAELKSGLLGGV